MGSRGPTSLHTPALICLFYFSMGDGSANSGSHAHAAHILPSQSSPGPSKPVSYFSEAPCLFNLTLPIHPTVFDFLCSAYLT